MSKMLQRASHIHLEPEGWEGETRRGTTADFPVVPRERFSYWCFELLFQVCGEGAADEGSSTYGDPRRVAVLSLPALISRCRSILASFVADQELRSSLPFPR